MADFVFLVANRLPALQEALVQNQQEADGCREQELSAAVMIQRHFRGSVERSDTLLQIRSAVELQRVFRGHQARQQVAAAKAARDAEEEEQLLSHFATEIQRAFRGYHSRKNKHDMGARRSYLQRVHEKGEALRRKLAEQQRRQEEAIADKQERKARAEFAKVSENLHHLVSTKAQAGVMRPAYAREGELPTAFNVPIEDHLRVGAKRFIRTHGMDKAAWPRVATKQDQLVREAVVEVSGATGRRIVAAMDGKDGGDGDRSDDDGSDSEDDFAGRTLPRGAARGGGDGAVEGEFQEASEEERVRRNRRARRQLHREAAQEAANALQAGGAASLRRGGVVVPPRAVAGPPPSYAGDGWQRRSLQSGAPYGAEERARRAARRYSKLKQLDAKPFRAGTRAKAPPQPPSVSAAAPYIPGYKATRMTRDLEHTQESKSKRVGASTFRNTTQRSGTLFENHERARSAARQQAGQAVMGASGGTGMFPPLGGSGHLQSGPVRTGYSSSTRRR